MALFERKQLATLLERLNETPRTLILVEGPRQAGKTTMITQARDRLRRPFHLTPVDRPEPETTRRNQFLAGDTAVFDVSQRSGRDVRWLVGVWEQARSDADRSEHGGVLALDEIQKIPNWSEAVKGLWDADRGHRRRLHVILSGSAPLLMQRGLTESLAGRFETIQLRHWSFAEMSQAFGLNLSEFVYFGGYPGAAEYIHDHDRWRDYILRALVEPNIERDILAMQRVDKPALLKRLFEVSAASSGQILSYTKMLGQLQDAGNTTTLARYLDLLEKAGLIAGLPKYTGGIYRRRASIPKLNVLNTALMSALSSYSFEEAQGDRTFWGRLVESAVGAHLWNTRTGWTRLWYWRDHGVEVDFVLERGPRLVAFEVKSHQSRADRRGLEEFRNRFGRVQTVVVGGDGVPVEEFLSVPADDWFGV